MRGAYGDLLPGGRHAELVLWLDLPPADVDVNVHPAKTEVRFRDATQVRNVVVSSIRQLLRETAQTTTTSLSDAMFQHIQNVGPDSFRSLSSGNINSAGFSDVFTTDPGTSTG